MPALQTRDVMRDTIRRSMGIRPGIDVPAPIGPLPVGDPDPAQPNPVNGRINDQISVTIANLNLKSGTYFDESSPRTYAVTAQTANGPYRIDFDSDQLIDIVRTAWFVDTSGNVYPLKPTSQYDLSKDQQAFRSQPPGTPYELYIIGYSYYLSPAPNIDGTLYASVGVSPTAPADDTESIPQLSSDEVIGVCVITARDLLAQEQTDAVNRSRLQWLNAKAEEWTMFILGSIAKRNESFVPGVSLRTNRIRPYRMR